MKNIVITILFSLFSLISFGQRTVGNTPNTGKSATNKENKSSANTVKRDVKNWILIDMESLKDSVAVDTLSQNFQIYNKVNLLSPANVQLGNIGASWTTAMISEMPIYNKFLFTKNLTHNYSEVKDWRYYNTKTPYTNLTYGNAGPKRRSEEIVGVLFTQNINPDLNIGFDYRLISSIGRYEAQKVDNRNFRAFTSYTGEKYSLFFNYFYNSSNHLENGGIVDEDHIWNPEANNIDKEENIRVNFYSASNKINQNRLHLTQFLNVGNVTIHENDSVSKKVPVATAIHNMDLSRYRRIHKIDNLQKYYTDNSASFYYKNIYADTTATRDSVYYISFANTFQAKFNEEANPLLKFGVRGFITNEIEKFKQPGIPFKIGTYSTPPTYRMVDTLLVTTLVGGQIFKNVGDLFKWNAGLKLYFQGYRAGDTELTGGISSQFRIFKDTAAVFANGGAYLVSPDYFTQNYFSNHFKWNNNFDQVQTYRIEGGIAIPTRRLSLSAETRLINRYVFWNNEALPEQSNDLVEVLQVKLKKHFSAIGFNSVNTVLYQMTSDHRVLPVPALFVHSSNYYQNILFEVLFFQLGFDLRYTTAWYTPAYMPATGQFYNQQERKVGDYPMVDLFLNMHLKRARIYVKVDHINEGYPTNRNYFNTIYYPMNPRTVRFGVSWNFYD